MELMDQKKGTDGVEFYSFFERLDTQSVLSYCKIKVCTTGREFGC